MRRNQEIKAGVVSEIQQLWESSQSVILVDYRGLSVEEDTQLRREMRAAGVEYKVLKNTLIQRAVADRNIDGLEAHLNGPTAVAFGVSDAVAPAKVLSGFIKKASKMSIKCGVMDGVLLDAAAVQALADLPSKEELYARLVRGMNAPVASFVGVLSATIRSLLYALNAVKDTKEA